MFYDRQRFGSAFAFSPSPESNYEEIAAFIDQYKWKRVFLLSETFAYWEPVSFEFQFTVVIHCLQHFEKNLV